MNELARRPLPHMTVDEFLRWDGDGSGRKFHLIDGNARSVPPASVIHGEIQSNLAFLFTGAARRWREPMRVVTEGAIIPALSGRENVRVPDVIAGPPNSTEGSLLVRDPVAVVEILSPGNKGTTRENVRAYTTVPSVLEILVVHTSRMEMELRRREPDGTWPVKPQILLRGAVLGLQSIGLICDLSEVYFDTWFSRATDA